MTGKKQIPDLTLLTALEDADLMLVRENSTDVDKKVALSTYLSYTRTGLSNGLYFLSEYSTVSDALTAIGAINATILIDSNYTVNETVSPPSNVSFKIINSGNFNLGGAYTFTFNNNFIDAPTNRHIFQGTGTYTGSLANNEVYPEWFGAVGDGVTDDYTPIQTAINIGSVIKFSDKIYSFSSTLTVDRGVRLQGTKQKITNITTSPDANEDIGSVLKRSFDTVGISSIGDSINTDPTAVGRIKGFQVFDMQFQDAATYTNTFFDLRAHSRFVFSDCIVKQVRSRVMDLIEVFDSQINRCFMDNIGINGTSAIRLYSDVTLDQVYEYTNQVKFFQNTFESYYDTMIEGAGNNTNEISIIDCKFESLVMTTNLNEHIKFVNSNIITIKSSTVTGLGTGTVGGTSPALISMDNCEVLDIDLWIETVGTPGTTSADISEYVLLNDCIDVRGMLFMDSNADLITGTNIVNVTGAYNEEEYNLDYELRGAVTPGNSKKFSNIDNRYFKERILNMAPDAEPRINVSNGTVSGGNTWTSHSVVADGGTDKFRYLKNGTEFLRYDENNNITTVLGDSIVNTVGKGFILKSPNGTAYRITVDNSGVLGTTAV